MGNYNELTILSTNEALRLLIQLLTKQIRRSGKTLFFLRCFCAFPYHCTVRGLRQATKISVPSIAKVLLASHYSQPSPTISTAFSTLLPLRIVLSPDKPVVAAE